MALLNLFLPLLFLLFSLGEIVKFSVLESVSIGLIDIVIFVIFTIWVFRIKKTNYVLLKPIIIFAVIAALSLMLNLLNFSKDQIFVSSLYLVRWILYSTIYFVFRDIGKIYSKKISKYMTIAGFIVVALGFAQLFFYPSLRGLYYLGWDEHLNRIFSTFLDPNFAGVVLVLLFVFVFVFKEKLFGGNKILYYATQIITFVAVILTYSRGSMLMLFSCAFFYSIFTKNWKFILLTMLVFLAVFIILIPGFGQEGTNLLRTASTNQRINSSLKALEIFQKNTLGVGFNTYRYAREKYGEIDTSVFGPSHAGAGVDNSFIFILVTGGVLGLASYVYLLIKMIKLGIMKKKNGYGMVLLLSLVGLMINSLTINSLFYSFIMLWVWSLAGLTESN